MKKNSILKSILIASVSTTAILASGYVVNAENTVSSVENVKAINEFKQDIEARETQTVEYGITATGGKSTAIVATIGGVDHLFLWGDNSYGQLGIGEKGELANVEITSSNFDTITKGVYNGTEGYMSTYKSVATPEDVNVDGGAAGIQGKVVSLGMSDTTTYVAIDPEDGNGIDFYAAGSNVYGGLGDGVMTNQAWLDNPDMDQPTTAPYSTDWVKVEFTGLDGQPVKFQEIYLIKAGPTDVFVSGKDTNGNNRTFAWGKNNMAQLGNGMPGSGEYKPADDGPTTEKYKTNIVSTPSEITDELIYPVYDSEGNWNFKDGYGFHEEITEANSDHKFTKNQVIWERFFAIADDWAYFNDEENAEMYNGARDSQTELPDYTYSIETTKDAELITNDETGEQSMVFTNDWKVINIIPGSTTTVIISENVTSGKRAVHMMGSSRMVAPLFATQSASAEGNADDYVRVTTGNGSNDGTMFTYRANSEEDNVGEIRQPLLTFFDGAPLEMLLFNVDGSGNISKYADAEEVKINDAVSGIGGVGFSVSIDGKSEVFTFGKSTYTLNGLPKTNGTKVSSKENTQVAAGSSSGVYTDYMSDTYKWDLGYDEDGVEVVPEVVQMFATTKQGIVGGDNYKKTAMNGALVKTVDETDPSKHIYSLIGYGANDGKILDPVLSASSGDTSEAQTTKVFLTTATSYDQIASNSLIDQAGFDTLVSYGRTIDTFLNEPLTEQDDGTFSTGETLYDEANEYEITNVIAAESSLMIEISDGTNIYHYYMGDNSSDQISSNYDASEVITPISLKLASSPLSDSFKLNYNTVKAQGIDFSIDVIHGGEIEKMFPTNEDGTSNIKIYADINSDGTTDTSDSSVEYFGEGGTGTIEYIGRGTTLFNEDEKNPIYNMEEISSTEQDTQTYKETYNFRISGLDSGVSYPNLYASINGHHAVSVDGVLETIQGPKYYADSTNLLRTGSDYFQFESELMFGNSEGYDPAIVDGVTVNDALTEEQLLSKTIIAFETTDGVVYTNNVEEVSKGGATEINEISLRVDYLDSTGAQAGLTTEGLPQGQKVQITVFGENMPTGKTISNFKLYFDSENDNNVSLWEDAETPYFTTQLSSSVKLLSKLEAVNDSFELVDGAIDGSEETSTTPTVAIRIKEGTITETVDESTVTSYHDQVDTDSLVIEATLGEEGEAGEEVVLGVSSFTKDETKTDGTYNVTFSGLQANAHYSNFSYTVEEETMDTTGGYSDAHHAYVTAIGTDSDFVIDTADKGAKKPVVSSLSRNTETEVLDGSSVYTDFTYSVTAQVGDQGSVSEYLASDITSINVEMTDSTDSVILTDSPDVTSIVDGVNTFDFDTGGFEFSSTETYGYTITVAYGSADDEDVVIDGTINFSLAGKDEMTLDDISVTSAAATATTFNFAVELKDVEINDGFDSYSITSLNLLDENGNQVSNATIDYDTEYLRPEGVALDTAYSVSVKNIKPGTDITGWKLAIETDSNLIDTSAGSYQTKYEMSIGDLFTEKGAIDVDGNFINSVDGDKEVMDIENLVANVVDSEVSQETAKFHILLDDASGIYDLVNSFELATDNGTFSEKDGNLAVTETIESTRSEAGQIALTFDVSGLNPGTTYNVESLNYTIVEGESMATVNSEIEGMSFETLEPIAPEKSDKNFPWWILILLLITLVGAALFLVWFFLLNNKYKVVETTEVSEGKASFRVNSNEEFSTLINGRELKGTQGGVESTLKYTVSGDVITVTGISNDSNISKLVFPADEASNAKALEAFEKALAKWETAKAKAEEAEQEFTDEKPVKPNLAKDIKLGGSVKSEIKPEVGEDKGSKSSKEDSEKREALEKLTKPKLVKVAATVYDEASLKDYAKPELVDLIMDEDSITLETIKKIAVTAKVTLVK